MDTIADIQTFNQAAVGEVKGGFTFMSNGIELNQLFDLSCQCFFILFGFALAIFMGALRQGMAIS